MFTCKMFLQTADLYTGKKPHRWSNVTRMQAIIAASPKSVGSKGDFEQFPLSELQHADEKK